MGWIHYSTLPMWGLLLCLLAGIAVLVLGARWVTDAGVGIALRMGVRPLVVGLTIVALATSLPELVSSFYAAWVGSYPLVLGNVIGSNICNMGLVLGVAAVVAPIRVELQLLRREIPLLVGVSLAFVVCCICGGLEPWMGVAFLVAGVGYLIWVVRSSRRECLELAANYSGAVEVPEGRSIAVWLAVMAFGGLCLYVGSEVVVSGALIFGERIGVDTFWVGMTVLALGTSLPELVTSVVACLRGHGDLCVGNVIGSNLVNLFFVAGGIGAWGGLPIHIGSMWFELSVLMGMTLLMWLFLRTEYFLVRWEGVALVLAYVFVLVLSV